MEREKERDVTLNFADFEEVSPTPYINLSDLEEESCYRPKDGTPYFVVKCKPSTRSAQICPSCGNNILSVHGYLTDRRLVHDVNVGVEQVDLLVKVPRYRCEDCGNTFAHRFKSVVERRQMTARLYEQIRRDAFVRPFSDIGNDFGYSDTTIATIFDEYASELEAKRGPVVAPRVLGIDEKHIVHAMRAVFVDIETGTLLEMKAGNKRTDVIDAIESMVDYDKNIEIVVMDMYAAYRDYIQHCLPKAKIIVDKYHIYQAMNLRVRKTRTMILEYLKDQIKHISDASKKSQAYDVYNIVAPNNYLFKFGQEKLAEKESRITAMADVCKTFPEFNHLRLLKEGFELIYQCSDRAAAEYVFKEWEKLIPPRGAKQIEEWSKTYNVPAELFSEFRTLDRTIHNWYEEVFTYFEPGYRVTNAATEGLNNMIERFNRLGNGYSFERLRAKALFWHLAAPRVRYSLIYKTVSRPSTMTMNMMTLVGLDTPLFDRNSQVEEIEISSIDMTEIDSKRKPLSTFQYLPKDYVYI